jgi:ParB family chromosome partitioning protein
VIEVAAKKRLGMGLGALFPTMEQDEQDSQNVTGAQNAPVDSSAAREQGTQANTRAIGSGSVAVSGRSVPSGVQKGAKKTSAKGTARGRVGIPSLAEMNKPTDVFFGAQNVSRETLAQKNEGLQSVQGAYLAELSIDSIAPNAHQPRSIFDEDELAELAESIDTVGVLQPIVVRKFRVDAQHDYELIMGERRLRASQLAKKKTIPAIVRTTADEDMLRDALLENLHRVQLNPLEEAAAYQQMLDEFGLTQEQLSKAVSKSRSQIANVLRLLKLPVDIQKRIASGVLSAGHARALLGLTDKTLQESLAKRIVAEGLSVRSVEEIVAMQDKKLLKREHKKASAGGTAGAWAHSSVPDHLSDLFDTKVAIHGSKQKGKIEITFSSSDDLDRILSLLEKSHGSVADIASDGWV